MLFWIRNPGSVMGKSQDRGSGINIQDPQHCSLNFRISGTLIDFMNDKPLHAVGFAKSRLWATLPLFGPTERHTKWFKVLLQPNYVHLKILPYTSLWEEGLWNPFSLNSSLFGVLFSLVWQGARSQSLLLPNVSSTAPMSEEEYLLTSYSADVEPFFYFLCDIYISVA